MASTGSRRRLCMWNHSGMTGNWKLNLRQAPVRAASDTERLTTGATCGRADVPSPVARPQCICEFTLSSRCGETAAPGAGSAAAAAQRPAPRSADWREDRCRDDVLNSQHLHLRRRSARAQMCFRRRGVRMGPAASAQAYTAMRTRRQYEHACGGGARERGGALDG